MNVLLITAGRGPAECRRHLQALAPAIVELCAARGVEVAPHVNTPASITYRTAASLADLTGSHCVLDATRGRRARSRWFLGVSVHPLPTAPDSLDPSDLEFSATTARGPGGQHVNKAATAVRLRHRPSGLVVVAQDERSQAANRRLAQARLLQLLAEAHALEATRAQLKRWQAHNTLVRGDPVCTWRYDRRGRLRQV